MIADEITKGIGDDIVVGELTWYCGSCRRTHWWVEKDGRTYDPMGDDFLSKEECTGRVEAHRSSPSSIYYCLIMDGGESDKHTQT